MPEALRALVGSNTFAQSFALQPFYMVARPGFFGGFGSWLDMFSPLSWNYGRIPSEVDYDSAMVDLDWQFVGMDMQKAIAEQHQALAA